MTSSSLPESAGTPKSDPPSWLRGCQALPQPRRPLTSLIRRGAAMLTRAPRHGMCSSQLELRGARGTSGFPSLSSSSVNVVVMQMPHGQPSSLRRQKAGRHQAADAAANDGHHLAGERARRCHGVDYRLFRRRATPWRRAAATTAPCEVDAREVLEGFVPCTEFLDPVDGVRAGHRASRRGSASISKNGV